MLVRVLTFRNKRSPTSDGRLGTDWLLSLYPGGEGEVGDGGDISVALGVKDIWRWRALAALGVGGSTITWGELRPGDTTSVLGTGKSTGIFLSFGLKGIWRFNVLAVLGLGGSMCCLGHVGPGDVTSFLGSGRSAGFFLSSMDLAIFVQILKEAVFQRCFADTFGDASFATRAVEDFVRFRISFCGCAGKVGLLAFIRNSCSLRAMFFWSRAARTWRGLTVQLWGRLPHCCFVERDWHKVIMLLRLEDPLQGRSMVPFINKSQVYLCEPCPFPWRNFCGITIGQWKFFLKRTTKMSKLPDTPHITSVRLFVEKEDISLTKKSHHTTWNAFRTAQAVYC